jgi:dienelactone hydrolase
MKKTIVLLLALFLSTAGFAQGIINLINKSQNFFVLMEQKNFTQAHDYFDSSVSDKISIRNLDGLWAKLNENLGKLESADVVQSKTEGEYFYVYVEGKFANDSQNFLLVYNKSEKLVGLFLPPKTNRAQHVKAAYADTAKYTEKEIYIETPGHKLVGKLTQPKNVQNFPIVVLVHGSGPADMDATVGGNKIFADLAQGLASQGIGSIRYVKRTMVYAGEFGKTFTVKEETIDDALAAIALARTTPGVNPKKIFLLGHSLGGMLAPRIAALVPDLNGIVIAAGPARTLTDVLVDQNKYLFSLAKDSTGALKGRLDTALLEVEKSRISKMGTLKPDSVIIGLPVAYWVDLNSSNQVSVAQKLKQRIMVIQGGNDFQVYDTDYNLWNTALGKKKNATLKLYPALNHFFSVQTEKGTSAQYQTSANVSEQVINDLAAWIKL